MLARDIWEIPTTANKLALILEVIVCGVGCDEDGNGFWFDGCGASQASWQWFQIKVKMILDQRTS
jgi:hypothetical protein